MKQGSLITLLGIALATVILYATDTYNGVPSFTSTALFVGTTNVAGALASKQDIGGGTVGTVINSGTPVTTAIPTYSGTTGTNIIPSSVTISALTNLSAGNLTITGNGAVSDPAVDLTGTWFTGGSVTTTKPHLLIEPGGTTSTGWSTAGTGLGINAATGFTGNLIDAQLAGTSSFKVGSSGAIIGTGTALFGGGGVGYISGSGIETYNGGYFGFSSTGTATGSADTYLFRGGAANVIKQGIDAATPLAQTYRGADGSGADKTGAAMTFGGGGATGTGLGGALILKTSITNTTGSTVQTFGTRKYIYAGDTSLTESTATGVIKITCAAKKFCGVRLLATTHADDNTDFQSVTDNVIITAVAKATTITSSTPNVTSVSAVSAGTLTTTWDVLDNGDNTFTLRCNAVSSLTQVRLKTAWQVDINSDDPATITPL